MSSSELPNLHYRGIKTYVATKGVKLDDGQCGCGFGRFRLPGNLNRLISGFQFSRMLPAACFYDHPLR